MNLDIEYKNNKKIFNLKFGNLTDLYYYLKNKPKLNRDVFQKLSSLTGDYEFAGEKYDVALEYILGGYTKNIDKFFNISSELRKNCFTESDELIQKRGMYGGAALAPLVAAGVPDCMLKYERNQNTKVINLYFSLGYSFTTSEEAINNRGIATIYIIQSLEQKGYIVNFFANEISYSGNEIINNEIKLKQASDSFFNIEKCYYPLHAREFLRRILFRVAETVPVTRKDWGIYYGGAASSGLTREVLNLKDDDLIIAPPNEIDIWGNNIYRDTKVLIKYLHLEDEFDMKRLEYYAKNPPKK